MLDAAYPARARVESPHAPGARSNEFSAPSVGGPELDGLAGRRGPCVTGQEPLAGAPASGSCLSRGHTGPSGPAGGASEPGAAPAPSPRALDIGEEKFAPPKVGANDGARKSRRRNGLYLDREAAACLLPGEAVARCGRWALNNPKAAGVPPGFVSVKVGKHGASFGNVCSCNSVWQCPVHASKIAAARAEETRAAIDRHLASGGIICMATLTIQHHEFQRCDHLKDGVAGAYRRVAQGKEWKPMKEAAGMIGSISALEVTHGGNGWHPHKHVLFFFDHQDRPLAMRFGDRLFARWARAAARMGFGRCSPNAFKFEVCERADQAGDYVSKWGPEHELTHAHAKQASNGGRSPWQILTDYRVNGRARDGELFREYALAFKGAKQLNWSHGLKVRLGIDEKSDDELAETEPPAETVALVHEHALQTLMAQRRAAALLDAAEAGGGEAVIAFLYKLGFPQEFYRNVQRGDYRPPPTPRGRIWRQRPQDMAGTAPGPA